MIVIRIDSNGNFCNSVPCSQCLLRIKNFGINKIIYSDDNGLIVKQKISEIISEKSTADRSILRCVKSIDQLLNN